MRNLKQETIGAINGRTILWGIYSSCNAEYEFTDDGDIKTDENGNDIINYPHPPVALRKGYTPEDLEAFLNSMDFEYDNGYGLQEIGGIVVFTDGSWLTRGEYDGSEWWENHQLPKYTDYIKE